MAKTLDEINPDPRRASSNPTIKDLPRIRVGRRRDSLPTPLRSLEQALTKSAMACGICWDPAELAWTCPETRNVFCSTCMAEYVLTMARHNQRTSGPRIPCPEQLCEYNLTTEDVMSALGASPLARVPPAVVCTHCHTGQGARCLAAPAQCLHTPGPAPPRADKDQRKEETGTRIRTRVWLYLHTRRCPRCGVHVQRTEGCPHMRCVCHEEFCYDCGKTWSRHGVCRRGMAKTVVCVVTAPFWVAPYLIFKSVRGVVRKVARAKHKADQRRAMRTAPPAA